MRRRPRWPGATTARRSAPTRSSPRSTTRRTTCDFASGTHTGPGGTITCYLRLEGPARGRIGQVLITGDFFVAPPRTVLDLEAALRGAYVADAAGIIERFFQERTVAALSVGPDDFRTSLEHAIAAAGSRA